MTRSFCLVSDNTSSLYPGPPLHCICIRQYVLHIATWICLLWLLCLLLVYLVHVLSLLSSARVKKKSLLLLPHTGLFLLSLPQGVEGRSMDEERVKGGAAAAEPLEAEARAEARPGKRRFGAVGPPAS
jgi:hypothetical protein